MYEQCHVLLYKKILLLDWCFTRRKKYAVLCGVLYSIHPTSVTVLRSICFLQFCNIDMTYSTKIFQVLFFLDSTYMTHAVYSPLFSEIERKTESRGWWKGCGGGRLTWEERMTALIIKNVLLPRYLEASLPFLLLLSNNSLVTSLHCLMPRLLTRLWHWQKRKKEGTMLCVLSNQFCWNQFLYSLFHVCLFFTGPLIIKFNGFFTHSLLHCLSGSSHSATALVHFFNPPLTYHLHTPQRGSYRDTH